MNPEIEKANLRRAELWISFVLRWGLWLSAAVLAVGMLTSWLKPNSRGFSPQELQVLTAAQGAQAPGVPYHFDEWVAGLTSFDAGTVIALGVVLLIALPVVRVALAAGIFFLERDRVYVGLSLLVLTVLLFSMFLGKGL